MDIQKQKPADPGKQEPRFSRIKHKLHHLNKCAEDVDINIKSVNDRLIGEHNGPIKGKDDPEEVSVPNTFVDEVLHELQSLDMRLGSINQQINRLSSETE